MSLTGAYDDGNVFAKILRGEMPCVKVYEDEIALAFMDIFPQSRGHLLVIPKGVKARNFLDLPPDLVGPYLARVQRLAQAAANSTPKGNRLPRCVGTSTRNRRRRPPPRPRRITTFQSATPPPSLALTSTSGRTRVRPQSPRRHH